MKNVRPQVAKEEGQGRIKFPPRFASEEVAAAREAGTLTGLHADRPHQVELDVQRELLAQPSLHFASLVVRRIDNGVCLQGVLEADDDSPDVCRIAQRVAGVREVLNRLVVASRRELPAKG